MSPRTKLVLIFAGKALGFLIVLSLLWHFVIASPYNRALVAITDRLSGANIILGKDADEDFSQLFSAIYGIPLKEDYICVATLQPRADNVPLFFPGSALHYGMLLVISLIAATPGLGWQRRLKFIGLALVIMFSLHLSTILILAKISLSGIDVYPFATLFITLGTALFPTLIWGILCYRYWWPRGVSGS